MATGREDPTPVQPHNTSYHHSDSPSSSREDQNDDYCGDHMPTYKKNTLRVGFINISRILNSNTHEKLIGLAKVNQHWMKIDSNNQWKMRTMGW